MTTVSKPKVFVETFGCQMNVRDSEETKGLLLERRFTLTDRIDQAEVILLNTCSVRQHAEERIFSRSGKLAGIKKRRPDTVIGIMGCMAQEHGARFFRRMPALDLVCGPGNLSEIPDLIDRVLTDRKRHVATDRINDPEYAMDGMDYRSHTVKALVNIMSGCDHRCTFCIVPMTRGIERSRPSDAIVREVHRLAGRGFRDVMLLGQNVNGYGKKLSNEAIDFAGLLRRLDQETTIDRIRFTTSHPMDASDELFGTMAQARRVCAHLHLPVQSGSNHVLKRMKRQHTREWYLDRVRAYRAFVPGGSLTTDFIVGFPGETDEDFLQTKTLMEEVRYDSAYIFKYSPRPGTPAFKMGDDVPATVKDERLQEILKLQKSITLETNARLIGQEVEVLFEDRQERDPTRCVGRTATFKRVLASSPENLIGRMRQVRVTEVFNESLLGEVTRDAES